jgi:hypothetical protein
MSSRLNTAHSIGSSQLISSAGAEGCSILPQSSKAASLPSEEEETMKPTASNSFKSRRSRLARPLSGALDKQLASYAAAASAAEVGRRARAPEAVEAITRAASAAGVGLLLTAGPASARIVYTPVYTNVGISSPISLDLNHDGITDFNLFVVNYGEGGHTKLGVSPAEAGNAILGNIQGVLSNYGGPFTCHVASALPAGHRIGPGSRFGRYQTITFRTFLPGGTVPPPPTISLACGYWGNAQGRFLGFEFTIQGQKHFGWARLNLKFFAFATLTGYAYETEANKPIRAGDTGPVADARAPEMHSAPPAVATVQPATLGVLALGSAGLDMWRKEQ